jgi:tetratricopeptide (TPR) repeat protein
MDFAIAMASFENGNNQTSLLRAAVQNHQAGRLPEALGLYDKVIALAPHNGAAYCNKAALLASQGKYTEAILCLEQAVAFNQIDPDIYYALGNCLTAAGRTGDAIQAYRNAIRLKPDFADAHFRLGFVLSENDRIAEGFAHFIRRAYLTRDIAEAAPAGREPPHKTKHDQEQREYLIAKLGSKPRYHLEDGERLAGRAVNPANATPAVLQTWKSSWPQLVVIDNFLTQEALEKLRAYCAGSTIWHRIYKAGYLGATPEDGLACPLMAQIAEEMRSTYPEILGAHPFRYLGAFKYDSALSTGTNTHADNSAVNFNLYIAPDDANLDPESGGMDVWDVVMPAGVDMRIYNGDEAAAQKFLTQSNARLTVIPHRANRAILFKSDLFHKTGHCSFKEGYENKRINISLLFGDRGAPTR